MLNYVNDPSRFEVDKRWFILFEHIDRSILKMQKRERAQYTATLSSRGAGTRCEFYSLVALPLPAHVTPYDSRALVDCEALWRQKACVCSACSSGIACDFSQPLERTIVMWYGTPIMAESFVKMQVRDFDKSVPVSTAEQSELLSQLKKHLRLTMEGDWLSCRLAGLGYECEKMHDRDSVEAWLSSSLNSLFPTKVATYDQQDQLVPDIKSRFNIKVSLSWVTKTLRKLKIKCKGKPRVRIQS